MWRSKLPRKRKKAFIKKHGQSEYWSMQILNDVLFESTKDKQMLKFPELKQMPNYTVKRLFYW
jgi:hypothetical protein